MGKKFVPDFMERTFYTSGPQKIAGSMASLLKELGVPEKQIKQEYFPGYD